MPFGSFRTAIVSVGGGGFDNPEGQGGGGGGPTYYYNLANISYDNVFVGVGSGTGPAEINPFALTFNGDGTRMYFIGYTNDTFYQFNLSTAWDISTASYQSAQTYSITTSEGAPQGVHWITDGTYNYLWEVGSGSDYIRRYGFNGNAPGDIGSISAAGSQLISSVEANAVDIYVNPAVSKCWIAGTGSGGQYIREFDCPNQYSPYQCSQIYALNITSTIGGGLEGLEFTADGTKFFALSRYGGTTKVYQFSMTTAWDISTASYDSVVVTLSQDGQGRALRFNNDGSKLYMIGTQNDKIYQYSTV